MSGGHGKVDRADSSEELARFLLSSGALSCDWLSAFRNAPRSAFLPDLVWPYDMATGTSHPVDRRADAKSWQLWVHKNVPLTIQWDDGRHSGKAPGHLPTSSASMPSVVTRMLSDLEVFPGSRVLEIGTGSGWNAGLLSTRLGSRRVVTVEVDSAVAAQARAALAEIGLHPEVICADGRFGWPAEAPYDRVIVAAGVREFPTAWAEQTRPGGLIVAPWGTHYSDEDALVRLTVAEDGSASGPFLRPLEFMKLRAQRLDWRRFAEHVGEFPGNATVSSTSVGLAELSQGRRFQGTAFILGLCVPHCAHVVNTDASGSTFWFFDMAEGSRGWASVAFRAGMRRATVHQSGHRRLWDEVSRALEWWRGEGSPTLDRFGLTVTSGGDCRPWLGDPAHRIPAFAR
ncbi:methyltransferase domain-containing protein [Streptomyces sp. NPDC006925]|uniref:methyltransferase domain-containing protein n=1 Tax=Streptomyces sp. NPDC006925 TaxID=3364768 RepID=UPI0036939571